LLVAGLLWLVSISSAVATTEVSGDRDANAPLIIDPETAPTDPLTREISLNGGPSVMFIQKMPVTKIVNEITIGDIGQAAGCTTPTRTRLFVREHPGDPNDDPDLGSDFYASQQIIYSTDYVALPSAPSKVTYAIPPTTFRKGRGYSFLISASYSSTDCKLGRHTTWAHNGAQINAGPATCVGAPASKRMWHASGADDADPACVTRPEPYRTFKPTMPQGWLVSRSPGAHWDIMGGSYPSDESIPSSACSTSSGSSPLALGAGAAFWRVTPGTEGTSSEYVCRWGQFADHGDTVEDGWYYAQPWLVERGGAPRDMYLELDTIDYSELLERHAPILAFDWDENFYPQDAGAFSNFAEIPTSGYEADSDFVNVLYDEPGEMIAAAGSPGPGAGEWPYTLSLDALGANYRFGEDPLDQPLSLPGDYIDARGSTEAQYSADSLAQHTGGYEDVVYGRILHDPTDDRLWLQYWAFYYFNSFSVLGVGVHEGDWEMVQVALSPSGVPQEATFAAHDYGFKLAWQDVDKGGVAQEQPIVYVAARSHASYPTSGETDIQGVVLLKDQHWGDGPWFTPPLVEVDSGTAWTGWEGRWGASVSGSAVSPVNPSQQAKWGSPSAFHAGATEW
jgi:hypothetical protein